MSKKTKMILLISFFLVVLGFASKAKYDHDKNQYHPKLWIGFFDYRINFRDLGKSLNQCMGKELFRTGVIYRSNKYFSGWSCDKIGSPDFIYSLNFNPREPHEYYCIRKDQSLLKGRHFNTHFEISDIENLENWKKTEFKKSMCDFFRNTITDINQKHSLLFHCDVGRDRTGAFAAMLSVALAEQKNLVNKDFIHAVECDYEKTSALEKDKFGKMNQFILDFEEHGGVSQFLETQCQISPADLLQAADHFIL